MSTKQPQPKKPSKPKRPKPVFTSNPIGVMPQSAIDALAGICIDAAKRKAVKQ